jgi:hypothetical protein
MAEVPGPLHSPDPSLGGPDIDAAVQNAESGTLTEGVHRPAAPGEGSEESRLEQMRQVDTSAGSDDPDPEAGPADVPTGPLPDETGSGGAQRIVGARISDRVAGGAPRPDGPPFGTDEE